MTEGAPLPLADVRVLAVEQFGAGPWATLQLADLGADVIKIEDPASGGDVGRMVPPYREGDSSLFFEAFNRGKRSVALDLRTAGGRRAFADLARQADAVFCNLRGDQPEKLGLTYDALAPANPGIVCCSLSGFGMTGPRAAQPAYDYVVQAMAGWMDITGEPDGPPTKSGLSLVDLASGYVAALALLAGLLRARATGRGCDCDVSLFDTALALLGYVGTWTASAGFEARRMPHSAHPSIVPFQAFATADGWVVVACAKQKFWERLCLALGRGDLTADPRFADFAGRDRHRDVVLGELESAFADRDTTATVALLEAAGVPCGPVNTVAEALRDPQARQRRSVEAVDHPAFGTVRHVATPLRLSGPRRAPANAPGRGEHTTAVLAALCGYPPDVLRALAEEGAFG
jgi:crotonobetainyl-CoA:carnitine CoA-transferase CaiB-like acyl-CoA transferase